MICGELSVVYGSDSELVDLGRMLVGFACEHNLVAADGDVGFNIIIPHYSRLWVIVT